MVLGITLNEEIASLHLDTAERIDIAFDVDLPALHPAANIHIAAAVDGDRPCGHPGTDVLHAGTFAVDHDVCLSSGLPCSTRDFKEVPECHHDLALVAGEFCYLGRSLSGECIRGEAVALEHEFGSLCRF